MIPCPPLYDDEVPKKEIKIRLTYSKYQEIKKIIKNGHFNRLTDFCNKSVDELLARHKDKVRKRQKGKRGLNGSS